MRTRMSGGVGRAVSNGGPYPIYAFRTLCYPSEELSSAFLVVVHNRFHVVSATTREKSH